MHVRPEFQIRGHGVGLDRNICIDKLDALSALESTASKSQYANEQDEDKDALLKLNSNMYSVNVN